MTQQLTTVDAILQEMGIQGELSALFPSGRRVYINASMENLASRVGRWLRDYRVQYDNPGQLDLLPMQFEFCDSRGNRQDLYEQRNFYQRSINNSQRTIDQIQINLNILDTPRPASPSIAELQALVDRWPELTDIQIARHVTATFVPVIFYYRGKAALSSSLKITLKTDSSWQGSIYSHHPHMSASGMPCLGNIQGVYHAAVESNQVIAALNIIRQWRLGYNPGDEVSQDWAMSGWVWLQDVRSGAINPPWDGVTIQDNRSGALLPLEQVLNGRIDNCIHDGMNNGWVDLSNLPTIQQGDCSGCKVDSTRCSCHGCVCPGCNREENWCICPNSRYVLSLTHDAVWAIMPPNEYTTSCAECGKGAPSIVYLTGVRSPSPSDSRFRARYCESCAPQEYVKRALEIRDEMRGPNDSTHENSTSDDRTSRSEGA